VFGLKARHAGQVGTARYGPCLPRAGPMAIYKDDHQWAPKMKNKNSNGKSKNKQKQLTEI
jgi:hypothetical protein